MSKTYFFFAFCCVVALACAYFAQYALILRSDDRGRWRKWPLGRRLVIGLPLCILFVLVTFQAVNFLVGD